MAGRPKKAIDWSLFEQLCALQCTQKEIASVMHIHHETLIFRVRDHYKEDYPTVYKRFAEHGKCSLRRNQFALSKKNASMAIWLGKVHLGQKDPGLDEAKEEALEAVKSAIRDIQREPRIESAERPPVENQQPLLDKKRRG